MKGVTRHANYRIGPRTTPTGLKSKTPCEAVRREAVDELGPMKLANPPCAQFEILVDGKPRSYRDIKALRSRPLNFSKAEIRTAKLP